MVTTTLTDPNGRPGPNKTSTNLSSEDRRRELLALNDLRTAYEERFSWPVRVVPGRREDDAADAYESTVQQCEQKRTDTARHLVDSAVLIRDRSNRLAKAQSSGGNEGALTALQDCVPYDDAPSFVTVLDWTGAEIRALREARRMSIRGFAAHLGVSHRMVSKWEARPDVRPRPVNQAALDTSLARVEYATLLRFVFLCRRAGAGLAESVSPRPHRHSRKDFGHVRANYPSPLAVVAASFAAVSSTNLKEFTV